MVCIKENDPAKVRAATICAKDKDKAPNAGPFKIQFPENSKNSELFNLEWDEGELR